MSLLELRDLKDKKYTNLADTLNGAGRLFLKMEIIFSCEDDEISGDADVKRRVP